MATPSAPMTRTPIGGCKAALDRGLGFGFYRCGLSFNFLGQGFGFSRFLRLTRARSFFRLAGWSRDLRRFRRAEARGAFLRLGLPVGASEAFGGGEVPCAGGGVNS